ncbi:hypothetical protein NA57DRAFT_59043 [Rhizodiscina lignyota]|uniref:Transcription factor IIIC subunit 5 HTH domain-containing protein n=1 Tax=Rhizodiscina lignyota TaxID=1504668 RepID=A0A9P4M2S5_9PEZI|nr:hypothetical protein NA57DRAFT_59043 [Rhizodiscina lignyota]
MSPVYLHDDGSEYRSTSDYDSDDALPWNIVSVNEREITSIEHPCVIQNVDNAIKSLSGKHVLDNIQFLGNRDHRKELGVSLRPNDPLAKSIQSRQVFTKDVLLRITLPKRTGRKRKRGSDDPFTYDGSGIEPDPEHYTAEPDPLPGLDSPRKLLRSLRDNEDRYQISAAGMITTSHRYRSVPDYQHATTHESLFNNMRSTLLTGRFEDIIKFKPDPHRGVKKGETVGPPASYTGYGNLSIPSNYSYRQGQHVAFFQGEGGKLISTNTRTVRKTSCQVVPIDTETIPASHNPRLVPEAMLDPVVQDCINTIRTAMEERPIMTRRYVFNLIGKKAQAWEQRFAWPYVGYVFRTGPWKDALIKFGVDPRKDPNCRHFQVQMFKLHVGLNKSQNEDSLKATWLKTRPFKRIDGVATHIFDGKNVYTDSKIWQLCDITDPLLRGLLDTTDIRTECDLHGNGWYWSGTLAKQQSIMRHKMDIILGGGVPDDGAYIRLKVFPEHLDEKSRTMAHWDKFLDTGHPTRLEIELGERIRSLSAYGNRRPGYSTHVKPMKGANENASTSKEAEDDGEESDEGSDERMDQDDEEGSEIMEVDADSD